MRMEVVVLLRKQEMEFISQEMEFISHEMEFISHDGVYKVQNWKINLWSALLSPFSIVP